MPAARRSLPASLSEHPFSIAEAAEYGLNRHQLRRRGLLIPFHGVRTTAPLADVAERAEAYAVKLAPGAFFSHTTAAALHGMWLPLRLQGEPLLHVSVHKPHRAPRDADVAGHHLVPRLGLVQSIRGLPVASPIETWCQLATVLDDHDLRIAGASLLAKDTPNPVLVLQRLAEAVDAGARPRKSRLERVLPEIRIGFRSAAEVEVYSLLTSAGVRGLEINAPIILRNGRRYEGDLVHRATKTLFEYDGDHHRTDARQWRIDVARHEEIVDDGWRLVRVTSLDLGAGRTAFVAKALRLTRG